VVLVPVPVLVPVVVFVMVVGLLGAFFDIDERNQARAKVGHFLWRQYLGQLFVRGHDSSRRGLGRVPSLFGQLEVVETVLGCTPAWLDESPIKQSLQKARPCTLTQSDLPEKLAGGY
jgi:hypothetical protein